MYSMVTHTGENNRAISLGDGMNYAAIFEANGHIITGDIQLLMSDFGDLDGKFVRDDGVEVEWETGNVLYSFPQGFVFVGVATDDPVALYPLMLDEASMLPGQLSFIGLLELPADDPLSVRNNSYVQALGVMAIQCRNTEDRLRSVVRKYADLVLSIQEIDMEDWRRIIFNSMFCIGDSDVGDIVEQGLNAVDANIANGDVGAATDAALESDLSMVVIRALIYYCILQGLQ